MLNFALHSDLVIAARIRPIQHAAQSQIEQRVFSRPVTAAEVGGAGLLPCSPHWAGAGALGMLYGLMEQQSALIAYVDVFRWTALLAFFCAIASWLFKKPARGAPPPGVH